MVVPICETCKEEMSFVGEYNISCSNFNCPDYEIVFEYGGQEYPVHLADDRQTSFQWDHSDSHTNINEHSPE